MTLAELGNPAFFFDQCKEREDKIIDKKEVKTIYKEKDSKITYFAIELVNIILTGCNGGLC